MTHEQARQQIEALREQIEYHNKKYYTEDAPEISDYAYDMLYRRLENLEAAFPELKTEDSPTNRVGAAGYNTFAEVTHTVPMESLHDSFSEDELRDFDRRVRAVVDDPVYVVEPKFDGLSVALEYVNGVYTVSYTHLVRMVKSARFAAAQSSTRQTPFASVSRSARRRCSRAFPAPAPPWRQVFCAASTSRQHSIIPSCSASRPFWRQLCSPLKMQSASRSTLASVR